MKSAIKTAIALFTILIISAITPSCSKGKGPQMPPPTVIVAPVKAENISPSMDFVGQVVSKKKVDLRARVTGFLVKKGFDDGDYVKEGQLLFQIEQDPYKAEVKSAKAALLQAEAIQKNAEIEFNRYNTLIQKNATSRTEYDKAVMVKEKGIADTMAAKAKLESAELNLSYTEIYAPCNGRMGLAKYDVGNLVGPTSDPLAHITMLDPIYVEFKISETILVTTLLDNQEKADTSATGIYKQLNGQKVIPRIILSNGTEYPYPGEIYFVDNRVDILTGTITLRAVFPNPNHLLIPGAYVKVKVSEIKESKTILVPQKAVQESQDGKFVLVVNKEHKVEMRVINIIQEFGTDYIISEGVKAGEMIIIEGLQKARPGIIVNPLTEEEARKNEAKK